MFSNWPNEPLFQRGGKRWGGGGEGSKGVTSTTTPLALGHVNVPVINRSNGSSSKHLRGSEELYGKSE